MIDYEDQGVENSYLTPEEQHYPVEEQQILVALRYLADNDDGCEDKDHAGFSRIDGEFGRDLAGKEYPLTAKQLLAAHKICKKYQRTQLTPAGYMLPEDEAVQAVARRKEMQWTARQQQYNAPANYSSGSQARVIGLKDGMLGVMFPDRCHDFQSNLSKIKELQREVEGLRLLNPTMPRVCFVDDKRGDKTFKYWQCPLELAEKVVNSFPSLKATPDVLRLIDAEVEQKAEEQRKIEEAQRLHRERVERLLGALGDIDAPIGDRVLYAHQKEAIRTLIEWNGGILAHDPGLGKTSSCSMIAKAYMKAEKCRVVVVGPKTLRANWVREAGWMEVPIEYFTHDSIPTDIPDKFVLITDEAQAYQSRHAKRSKKFLELAWKAEAVICATGTPSKNGRPSNIYPLLLACKHPLVYAELSDGSPAHDQIKKLRLNFEKRYCAAQKTEYSQWDVTGAAFLEELHRKIVDTPRGVLRRRKDQCLDLPAKIRKLVPVELSKAEAESYRNEVSEMWNEYEARVEAKINEFKETKLPGKINQAIGDWLQEVFSKEVLASAPDPHELVPAEELAAFKAKVTTLLIEQERTRIESGQALVMLGHFRHAGSKAKARATIDLIDSIFEEDAEEELEAEREGRPHKSAAVIVFCAYKDTAAQIAEKFGVPVMSGDTPDKQRQPMVDAFQAGENRVFVGIYGAGGVGVTLTAANTVILVDRPWTPGEVEQAEDRCIAEGQLVPVREKGLIPIEQVEVGDFVLTHTGQWKRVTKTKRREHRGLMTRITYTRYSEPLLCTHDHKILVKRGDNSPEWILAHQILPKDMLVMPRPVQESRIDSIAFPEEFRHDPKHLNQFGAEMTNGRYCPLPDTIPVDDDLLYLFGWYLAEGFSSTVPGKGRFVSLSGHQKELPILEKLGARLEKLGVTTSIYAQKVKLGIELRAFSIELANWFADWFGKGAYCKHLPPEFLDLPPNQAKILLQGYTDGDGYSRKKQVEWISVSPTLSYQMCLLALKCGYSPTLRRVDNEHNKNHWVGCYTVNGNPDNKALTSYDDQYVYQPVRRVETFCGERKPPTYVHDLTVEDDHSFVVGQAIVHNCHRIGQDGHVLCQWLQIPQHINPVDAKIDAILQKKQENVVKMLDGGVGNYEPDLLFSNMAHDLLFEATHFKASKEVEVGHE